MILKSVISEVIHSQADFLNRKDPGLKRNPGWEIPELKSHVLIITGIRRCGKSTLLHQFMLASNSRQLYLNFDDPRLFGFNLTDFERLHEIIDENHIEQLFLDEIQLVDHWERFIRQLVDQQQYQIILTGSNAGMLSKELGTHLTGRHISKELFPFSYNEFIQYKRLVPGADATVLYMSSGGFPEFVKNGNQDTLTAVVKDILYRDISVRYGVRNHEALEILTIHLFSNLARPVSSNSLRKILGIGAASTVSEYLYYFEQTYLFFFINKFSYSYKTQIQNPRKVYSIDPGLATNNSISFSEDKGRYLENLVFLELRRQYEHIFYFSDSGECDFVVAEKGKARRLLQVCYQLTPDNMDREINGLKEAMEFFGLKNGEIITLSQTDQIKEPGLEILIKPFHEFSTIPAISP